MFKLVLSLCLVALAAASPIADDQTRSGRIVGGSSATAGQFPFMASIRGSGVHACGGALVSARWVISAAHCTRFLTPGVTVIVVGSISRTTGGTSYGVSRIVNHFDFDAGDMEDDISLLETATTVVFSGAVQPAVLGSGFIGSGVTVVIVGFGQTANPGALAETLQWISAPTITNANCRSRFSLVQAIRVQDEHICTLSPAGQGLCFGDGGTPSVMGNTVIGVNSWGIPCGLGSPDVHTRIGSFRTWISIVAGL